MKNWDMDQVLNNIPFPIWIKDLGKILNIQIMSLINYIK